MFNHAIKSAPKIGASRAVFTARVRFVPMRGLLVGGMMTVAVGAFAQPASQPVPQPDPLAQLQVTQPSIDVSSEVKAVVSFDPPVVRPGEKATYRVTFNALDESIQWPEEINAPSALQIRPSARGQVFSPVGNQLMPLTTLNHHVRAASNGSFTIPEFTVQVYGKPVIVPPARLEVSPQTNPAMPPPLQLNVELTETNIYAGQPVKLRVLLPSSGPNMVLGLAHMRLNGDGFLVDQATARQSIVSTSRSGVQVPTYVHEMVFTPLISGRLTFSAQAFTLGNRLATPVVIQGQAVLADSQPRYLLLDSDPITINVQPLPRAGTLPGFTGAIGKLTLDPPQLSANRVAVGDIVKLTVTFRGEGNLPRLIAPTPPQSPDWQVSPSVPGGVPAARPTPVPGVPVGNFAAFTYTLIPLREKIEATPPIPFSYFDPTRGNYMDLTIPSVPITVTAGATTVDLAALHAASALPVEPETRLTLSDLAPATGRTMTNLVPLQQHGWFVLVQLLPLIGFATLWAWDRRRRYFEQHPEVVRRRLARRALLAERRALESAYGRGDLLRYTASAVNALRIACAPHYPADERAMVCGDVLELLAEEERKGVAGEVVRRFFTVEDGVVFSRAPVDADGLFALQPELDGLLNRLEARLC